MVGRFKRSWEITKLSFRVIRDDKELLAFPILSFIFSTILLAALVFPKVITSVLENSNLAFELLDYVIIFLTYFGLSFIATFFNVCTVYTVKKRFEGGNSKFSESIGYGFSKIHLIFLWSLVSATVGTILRIIENIGERLGSYGQIIVSILTAIIGMIWGIITIFVVPVMVYEGVGPFSAIKSSINTLKKTWGENLIRALGLGLIQILLIFFGIILGGLLIVLLPFNITNLVIIGVVVLIYIIGVSLVFNIANQVFNTALYVYAKTGQVPAGYSQEILENTFVSKKKRRLF